MGGDDGPAFGFALYLDRLMEIVKQEAATGPEGKVVKRVLIEKGCNIADEVYVSLLVDRATSKVTLMASAEGVITSYSIHYTKLYDWPLSAARYSSGR